MGGEKLATLQSTSCWRGSPPRGRGKAFSVLRRQFRFRITPAWAGKSCTTLPRFVRCGDHPRVGGEKLSQLAMGLVAQGSPPRERGKGHAALAGVLVGRITPARRGKAALANIAPNPARITPAWAGKRTASRLTQKSGRDHPRMGGEKAAYLRAVCGPKGSPPHGRGKGQGALDCRFLERITPAWAGKSGRFYFLPVWQRGSPPRGRGKDQAG